MKTVLLVYPDSEGKRQKKFKVASSTKGGVFRNYIDRELTQFFEVDYFLVFQDSNSSFSFLDETLPFNAVSTEKKLIFLLVYRHVSLTIMTILDVTHQAKLNLSETTRSNIESFFHTNDIDKYVLAFKPTSDPTITRVASSSIPLILQGWYGEQLYLVRRVLQSEKEPLDLLFHHYVLSCTLGLSFLSLFNWAKSAALHYIILGNNTMQPVWSKFPALLPPHLRMDHQVQGLIKVALGEYSKLSVQDAMKEYILIVSSKSAQCCYIDRVQFLLMDNKWRMSASRFLYLSYNGIFITKDIGENLLNQAPITLVKSFVIENEFVLINFDNGEKWRIKSKLNKCLVSIIDELKRAIPNKITSHGSEKSIDIALSDYSEIIDEFPSLATDQEDEKICKIEIDEVCKEQAIIRGTINTLPNGVTEIVLPTEEEKEKPFDFEPKMYRDLRCIEQIKIINNDNEEMVMKDIPNITYFIDRIGVLSMKDYPSKIIFTITLLIVLLSLLVKWEN